MSDEHKFKCDHCGEMFDLDEMGYIGTKDGSDGCSATLAIEGKWKQLCEKCYQQEPATFKFSVLIDLKGTAQAIEFDSDLRELLKKHSKQFSIMMEMVSLL